jgi:2-aminoethylphosphonate-pyruvate transaminase
MITRAVILAAGRLPGQNGHDTLRSLTPVNGKPLLHWNIEKLAELGVREIVVVVGYRGDEIRTAVEALPKIQQVEVRVVDNPDWRLTSGISLLAARDLITERTFCILGDRMIHREDLRSLAALPADGAECVMLVDTDVDHCADLAGATKVRLAGGKRPRVVEIGEDLPDYQAYDCGHSLISPEIVGELQRAKHPRVADGLRAMAARGLVGAHEVRDRDWRRIGGFEVERHDPRPYVEGILEPKEGRYVLLNPGPVNTTARVKSALVHHDVCHRDSDYSEVLVSLQRKLRRIFRGSQDHSVVLITGSGTAAMECAIASCVPTNKKVLVIDNGAFGERLAEICQLHEMDLIHLHYDLGQEVKVEDVRALMDKHPDIAVVTMCHHETSVGLLNPIREIGALCRERDALLLVDAVSSLGAEDLDVVRDNIDVCWSSANKCLHGISGVGFLCVSPRTWAKIASIKPRVYYLDLKRYRKYAYELAQTPFTPAVATYFALDAACDEYLEDGAIARQAMYAGRNAKLRDALRRLGLGFFTETGNESHTVMTPRLPDYASFGELYEDLKAEGFIIYDCKPPLKGTYFQLANMGDLPDATLDAFLEAFGRALARAKGRRSHKSTPPVGQTLHAR